MSTLSSIRAAAAVATKEVAPPPASRHYTGVVVSAGRMNKTVKVRVMKQAWNKKVRKYFDRPVNYLTHDPASSLREGDIIRLASGHRYAKHVRHVATQIIAPFGPPIAERPALPSLEELQAQKDDKRAAKAGRRATRTRQEVERKMEAKRARRKPEGAEEMEEAEDVENGEELGAEQYKKGVRSDMVIEGSGGLHHPGKIHDRATANSQKAIKMTEKTEANEEKLKQIDKSLEQMRIEGKELGQTGAEELKQGSQDAEKKPQGKNWGWFGWR
ncbi:MAG: hypothetical protein M1821_002344 [Bathelium mastoideum]|nr:MAG: hypothetical protein M1821_002344 [Bathelium mastoideum]